MRGNGSTSGRSVAVPTEEISMGAYVVMHVGLAAWCYWVGRGCYERGHPTLGALNLTCAAINVAIAVTLLVVGIR